MSPGQDKHTHPYLKPRFYTELNFWETGLYTEKAKQYYRELQAIEQRELDKKAKSDSIIWACKKI